MPNTYTKVRALNYFDDLLVDLNGGIQKLFRKYSVHAADNSTGYTVNTATIANPYHRGDFAKGKVPDNKLVSWVHLEKLGRTSQARHEGFDTVYLEASINPVNQWNPCYFLPWKPQAMVYMTIPRQGTRVGNPTPPDPDIFFTAAINGCSVFIQGDPANPTIYHCGGDPDYPTTKRDPQVAATFWRNLVINSGEQGQRLRGEVNKTDYVLDITTTNAAEKSTASSRQYESWLKANTDDTVRIKQVKPWGCVFGIRRNGNWTFYLQENATIQYATIRKKKIALGPLKKKIEVEVKEVGRPMHVREIYPNGAAIVNFSPLNPISML